MGEVGRGAVTTRLVADFRVRVAEWPRAAGVKNADTVTLLPGAAFGRLVLHRALDGSLDFRVVAGPFRRLVTG